MSKSQWIGVALALAGGILWGFSGLCVQFLQQYRDVNPEWLVTTRLFFAGLITVIIEWRHIKKNAPRFFKSKTDMGHLILFSLFGVALCQYSYFRSIDYAGAGIATVLQYLAPSMLIIYMVIAYHHLPTLREAISVVLATTGTALIALHGEFSLDALDMGTLFWGLLSAAGVAIYSESPVKILQEYGTGTVVGVGLLLGSAATFLLWRPIEIPGTWDSLTFGAYASLIILGTVIAFNCYMEGVRRIGAVKGSILSSIEPISASIFAALLLGTVFTPADIAGFLCILSTIFILAFGRGK